jgi:hypothetical protein
MVIVVKVFRAIAIEVGWSSIAIYRWRSNPAIAAGGSVGS